MSVKMLQRSLVYGDEMDAAPLSVEKRIVLELIGKDKTVLEIGAYIGSFSSLLAERGCRVTAVELDPRAAAKAAGRAEQVIAGDIEDASVAARIAGPFDIVLFMHVLEHMIDPWKVLRQARHWLAPQGAVIVLIPNIACWRARKDLFFRGAFEYAETGILDRTHLRFFTLATARELLENSGYKIEHWEATQTCVPLERRLSLVPILRGICGRWHRWLFRRWPNLCSEIFLFQALPASQERV